MKSDINNYRGNHCASAYFPHEGADTNEGNKSPLRWNHPEYTSALQYMLEKELYDSLEALKGTCLKQGEGAEFLGNEGVLTSSGEVTKMHRLKWSFEPVGFLGEDGRHRQK